MFEQTALAQLGDQRFKARVGLLRVVCTPPLMTRQQPSAPFTPSMAAQTAEAMPRACIMALCCISEGRKT